MRMRDGFTHAPSRAVPLSSLKDRMSDDYPTSIRLPRALKARLREAAERENRPLSVQIVHILERWLEAFEKARQ